jgi:hypothetical protein
MNTMDKILADLFKGAAQNGKAVELDVKGHEEKLASDGVSALRNAYVQGMNEATERFKVSNLLSPLIGMGASSLGAAGVGRMLGSRAGGLAGQALQNLGGQVAQTGVEHLMAPRQPAMMPYTR